MKINFNTGSVPKAESGIPTTRPDTTTTATEGASFQATAALKDKLKNQPAVRAEKVENAKNLVSNSKYPPNDVLDRMAVLLAIHVKQ
jgi:hypothetical protein